MDKENKYGMFQTCKDYFVQSGNIASNSYKTDSWRFLYINDTLVIWVSNGEVFTGPR